MKTVEKITLQIENKTTPFIYRLWYVVSNPFLYLIKGKIRY